MDVVIEFACEHIGLLMVFVPEILCLLYFAWRDYQSAKIDAMWDGKPWDEAEYQRRVKEWERDPEAFKKELDEMWGSR